MPSGFVRTAEAEEDLIGIWIYIAKDNQDAADRLLDRIDEACTRLAQFPNMGTSYEQIRPSLRLFPVGNYLILYRVINTGIEVVRIVHGARQWQSLF